jgi:hypothetical protein
VAGTGAVSGQTSGTGGSAPAGAAVLGAIGLLCLGGPLALFFLLFRKRAGGTRTRIADDGFTLVVPGARTGQRVHYQYQAGGETKTGQATITGDPADGVFVYTGERPSGIVLLAAASALSSTPAVAPPPPSTPTPTPRPVRTTTDDDDDDDEPFRGFPSAY